VYYEGKAKTTVNKKGEKSIPMRDSGSNAKHCMVVLAVAADGMKLPPFVVFKGMHLYCFASSLLFYYLTVCCRVFHRKPRRPCGKRNGTKRLVGMHSV